VNTPSCAAANGATAASASISTSRVSGSNDDIIVLGDFTNYVIVDRVGMVIAVEDIVKGASRRPTGERGIFAWWRTGARSVNSDAFRMPRV